MAAGDRHLQVVSPITCRPWHAAGDGHPDEMFADDQRCDTTDQHIQLSLHEKIEMSGGEAPISHYVALTVLHLLPRWLG